MEEILRKECAP